ncbi:flagellar hook-length control protein FliK [Methylobacter sp.]|uniref:flagellar hook-length control protein FliK n=1 Tax=Methylobacter sp. TaxID=2051955 RepID=UPI002486EAA2|nr:flagellar hook-length control protein FliK [Methylobacter sp.]MDI1278022.1 flagellar hook-length control protein FliK [Methylobacter sp.]MDI1358860.1 flagellar hook-length control protein FliK [Methylobacter sp.]
MDINSLINTQPLLAPNKLLENTLNLKVGQQLDVKVINAEIQAAKNAVTLSLGGKDVSVQSNQPITLSPGQDLKIQVTQIAPSIEFKVLDPLPELKNQAIELRLKLIPTARDGGNAAPMRPTAKDAGSVATGRLTVTEKQDNAASPSSVKQLLDAKIISITGNKIQLQVFNPSTANTGNKQVAVITIDRTQLTNAPSDLKIGQNLNLEIVKTGTTPEFKIIPAATHIPEAKVAEFIKQFLPRHEASPIFLNQLIKDLPQLLKNESVPQALKDIAAKIVQNLPQKEQLVTSQGLKLAIANSGLFLEAKLPPALVQAELIKELPQLIKNESVPQSLQRIAAEILQNLTQKQPLLNNPVLQQLATNTTPIAETELATLKLNLPLAVEGENGTAKTNVLGAEDFKANLLKFIHALKQELATQGEQPLNKTDVDLLKNLQNKTENTVAKLVLDQLMSLPKEDSPKQLWVIDIPFIDRQQAETVKIEIQRDKENKKQSGSGDWSVNIIITPPGLGTIHCMVSYRNDAINTFFKSQNTQTTELIKHNLDYLKNQLEESGLKTGHMDAHDGAQKTQAAHPHQLAGKKLFDDNA